MTAAVSSTPILRRTLLWSALVTAALAVVGALIGYLADGASGLWSALVGVVLAALFLAITALSILIANRWFGTDLYVPVFFGIVLGGWLLKFVVFLVVLFAMRGQPWINPIVFFLAIVAGVLAGLAVDVVVLMRMRLPYAGETALPTTDPDDDPAAD